MIIETFAVFSMLIGGTSLVRMSGLRGWGLPILGAVAGISLYITIGSLLAISSLPSHPVVTMILTGLVPAAFWMRALIRGKDVRVNVVASLMIGVLLLGLIVLLRTVRLTKWSNDSLDYMYMGGLVAGGNFDLATSIVVPKRLVGLPVLHSAGSLSGEFFLAAITPLIAGMAVALIAWLGWRAISTHLGASQTVVVIAAGLLLLVTMNRFLFHAFYLNSHLLVGMLLLAFVGCGWLLSLDTSLNKSTLFMVATMTIAPIVFLRAEGSLMVGLAILPLIVDPNFSRRQKSILMATLGCSIIIWQGFVAAVYRAEGTAVPFSAIALLIVGIAVLGAIPVVRWKLFARRGSLLLNCAEGALWLALVVLFVREPAVLIESLSATVQNVVRGEGSWGGSLVVILSVTTVAVALVVVPGQSRVRFALTTFLPFVFLLPYFRGSSYRVGDGDSLNRMWFQIIPIAIFYLIVAVGIGTSRYGRGAKNRIPVTTTATT